MEAYLIIGIIGGMIVILGTVATLGRIAWRFLRQLAEFLGDWFGEEARPGVPKRPGVMERLDSQDHQLSDIQTRLTNVEAEVSPNTGKSMKDTVHRSDKRLERIEQHLGMENDV